MRRNQPGWESLSNLNAMIAANLGSLRRFGALLVLGLLPAVPLLHAQVVSDSKTNTLDSVTNTVTGSVIVGTNGSNTGLILTNGALLTNTLDGVIGFNTGANSNYV